jgi:hypothetical protein
MSYWRLYFHIIWATKSRKPLLKTEWGKKLYRYISGKTTALGLLPHERQSCSLRRKLKLLNQKRADILLFF